MQLNLFILATLRLQGNYESICAAIRRQEDAQKSVPP
jgi:hypothetical protein